MKKIGFILIAAVILLLFAMPAGAAENGKEDLVWAVAPILEYEGVYYCAECKVFSADWENTLDIKTGKPNGFHYGHGGWHRWHIYDAAKGLFGIYDRGDTTPQLKLYPLSEFASRFPYLANKTSVWYKIDSTMITQVYDDWEDAYIDKVELGKCAIAYDNKLVSDFIYDNGEMHSGRLYNNIIAVQKGDNWGIADKDGNIAAPFIFEHAISINDNTAFAKYNGKYGILDVGKTAANAAQPVTPALTAIPTASKVYVDGQQINFDAYNIGGNNYFKLRDLAYALNGTKKQFEIGWDGAKNAITITGGKPYTPVGGEMAAKGSGNKTPQPTGASVSFNGQPLSLAAYNIEGNNYFKLRDLGQALDFEVSWNAADNSITIDTGKPYEE